MELKPDRVETDATQNVKSFWRNEDGNMLIFTLFIFFIMLFTAGMAVDVMRHESIRVGLQNTSDSAVLAAAKLTSNATPEEVVKSYFKVSGYGDIVGDDDITVTSGEEDEFGNQTRRSVEVAVELVVPTAFMTLLDVNKMLAPAASKAEEVIDWNREIVLVLDISGSMSDSISDSESKIEVLKDSASTFVDDILLQETDPPKYKVTRDQIESGQARFSTISLVPYNASVNVGAALLSHYNIDPKTEHPFSHCVYIDDADFTKNGIQSKTAETPDILKQQAHFNRRNNSSRAINIGECHFGGRNQIIPHSIDADLLKAAIAAYKPSGNTATDLGAKWGAALLDPSFRPVVQGLRDNFSQEPEQIDNEDTFRAGPQLSYRYTGSVILGNKTPQAIDEVIGDNLPANYLTGNLHTASEEAKKILVIMSDGKNTAQRDLRTDYQSPMVPNGFKGQPSPVIFNPAPEQGARYSVVVDGDFDLEKFQLFLRVAIDARDKPASELSPYEQNVLAALNDDDIDVDVSDLPKMTDGQFAGAIQAWLDHKTDDAYEDTPEFYHRWSDGTHQKYGPAIDQEEEDEAVFEMEQLSWQELFAQYPVEDGNRTVARFFFERPRNNRRISADDYNAVRNPYYTSVSAGEANERLKDICDAAKDDKVEIYTIAFAVPDAIARGVLQYCATREDFYFPANDNKELRDAFSAISESIKQLRLTQ
ncbi:pilus assembly protein [Pseudaestuariivita rosea]|uniref:pilus assembly protein n=1 Tax=Pseudaestuariivita rosea TaxID=2763263 RepID=UPI001ABAF767|nr:Tad domain-containing protein [Pseudaestuariivita rosea]